MQRCNATVRLNNDLLNTVEVRDASPAEVIVLQHIHGDGSVADIRVTGNDRGNAERHHGELARLREKYGKHVAAAFPGGNPSLPETFAEAGISLADEPDDFEDEPDRTPRAAKKAGRKKKAEADDGTGPEEVTAADLAGGDAGQE